MLLLCYIRLTTIQSCSPTWQDGDSLPDPRLQSKVFPAAAVEQNGTVQLAPLAPNKMSPSVASVYTKVATTVDLRTLALDSTKWGKIKFKVATQAQADARFNTFLHVKQKTGSDLVCKSAPMEAYLCDSLHSTRHLRATVKAGNDRPPNVTPSHTYVDSCTPYFASDDKSFLCTRRGDSILNDCKHHIGLTSEGEARDVNKALDELVRAVAKHGSFDKKRSKKQLRVSISNIGQSYKGKGKPVPVVGKEFFEKLEEDSSFDADTVIDTLSGLLSAGWVSMVKLQSSTGGPPLAPDGSRTNKFAEHLRQYLRVKLSHFAAEDITIVVSILYPNLEGCKVHVDVMNDWRAGYTKTGVFQIMLISDDGGMVAHVQVRRSTFYIAKE